MRRSRAVGLAAVAVLALAGCTGNPGVRATDAAPFRPCPAVAAGSEPGVTGAGAGAGATAAGPSGSPGGQALPVAALPCFAGGQPVELTRLGRPAVVNLWASWCRPCRVELPQLQRLADAGGDRLVVLGVVTGDTRSAAAAAAADFGVTFPALFDPTQTLLLGLGRTALPLTVLLDAAGRVRLLYQAGEPLTLATLERLVAEHLGVVVS